MAPCPLPYLISLSLFHLSLSFETGLLLVALSLLELTPSVD